MKLARKERKHIKGRIRSVVSFFVFFQANLILAPFPTHRQQVPSLYPFKLTFGPVYVQLFRVL